VWETDVWETNDVQARAGTLGRLTGPSLKHFVCQRGVRALVPQFQSLPKPARSRAVARSADVQIGKRDAAHILTKQRCDVKHGAQTPGKALYGGQRDSLRRCTQGESK
jgi:hypothetical protein